MGKIQTVGKRGGMPHGKIKIFFFPRNVHTERFGAGPCMACDHAPKEKKSYGEKTWEIWKKLGIGGKKIWEIWEKLGILWEFFFKYGKNWVRFQKIEYFWDRSWEKWKQLGVFWEKKFEFGKF